MTVIEKQTQDRIDQLALEVRKLTETVLLLNKWRSAHMERHAEREEYDNYIRSAAGDRMAKR
jgi:acetyl-CoA carboxylase alpha subunit